jgi:DNA repair exonuclease SbcCD ATPase subunit
MNPVALTLSNFRTWREGTIPFHQQRAILITGPKGVGKTSVLDAIFWALYGEARNPTQDELVRAGERECAASFVFDSADGGRYQVQRRFRLGSRGKGGTTLLRLTNALGTDLTAATVAETQVRIRKIVGPYDVLASTAFVRQGEAKLFMAASPATRRELFSSMLAVDPRWDGWTEKAKAKGAHAQRQADIESARLKVLEEHAALLPERERALEDDRAQEASVAQVASEAGGAYEAASARARDAAAAAKEGADLEARLVDVRARLGGLERLLLEARDRLTIYEDLIARGGEIQGAVKAFEAAFIEYCRARGQHELAMDDWETRRREHDGTVQAARQRVSDLQALILQHRMWTNQIAELEGRQIGTGTRLCPTCGQTVESVEAAAAVAKVRESIEEQLAAKRSEIATFPDNLEQGLDSARTYLFTVDVPFTERPPKPPQAPEPDPVAKQAPLLEQAVANFEGQRQVVEQLIGQQEALSAEIARSVVRLAELQPQIDAAQTASRDATAAFALLNDANGRHIEAVRRRGLSEGAVEDAKQAVEDAAITRKAVDEWLAHVMTWTTIAEGCGPRGVRQLIADQAIQEAQDEANRHIAQLEPGFSVLFSTLSESGREVFDVRVMTPYGLYSYAALSGGQSVTVALGVRIGLAHVVARSHGMAKLPVMVFDEPMDFQDQPGRAAIVRALVYLSGVVDRVIVISHDAALAEAFGSQIRLELVDGETQVAA